jgi:hypothetical protein
LAGCNNGACSTFSTIAGGINNSIRNSSHYSFIGGGYYNKVCNASSHSSVVGGRSNVVNFSSYSAILGGTFNTINSGSNNTVIGGNNNFINGGSNNAIVTCNQYMGSCNNTLRACTMVKASGSFAIPHPDPLKTSQKELWHSFVESPTAGDNIYRYTVRTIDGVATLQLPNYYNYLNKDTQIFITPKDNFGIAYGTLDSTEENIDINSTEDGLFNVLIIGTRKDRSATEAWKGTERNIF